LIQTDGTSKVTKFGGHANTMPSASLLVKRPPACMAGDRSIQLSYRVRLAILKHAEMLQKSNARNLAHIRDTGHFFRFVFADEFLCDRNSRIL